TSSRYLSSAPPCTLPEKFALSGVIRTVMVSSVLCASMGALRCSKRATLMLSFGPRYSQAAEGPASYAGRAATELPLMRQIGEDSAPSVYPRRVTPPPGGTAPDNPNSLSPCPKPPLHQPHRPTPARE